MDNKIKLTMGVALIILLGGCASGDSPSTEQEPAAAQSEPTPQRTYLPGPVPTLIPTPEAVEKPDMEYTSAFARYADNYRISKTGAATTFTTDELADGCRLWLDITRQLDDQSQENVEAALIYLGNSDEVNDVALASFTYTMWSLGIDGKNEKTEATTESMLRDLKHMDWCADMVIYNRSRTTNAR